MSGTWCVGRTVWVLAAVVSMAAAAPPTPSTPTTSPTAAPPPPSTTSPTAAPPPTSPPPPPPPSTTSPTAAPPPTSPPPPPPSTTSPTAAPPPTSPPPPPSTTSPTAAPPPTSPPPPPTSPPPPLTSPPPPATEGPPHIIIMVADDLGYNDVSWHNSQVLTPHLEALARGGIILEQSYVQPICTPTRSALLSSRYPFTIGRQHRVLKASEPVGLDLELKLLPQALKDSGYQTHAVGKWHLGFCSWDYTPTRRGFDTFYGYYNGAEDYFTHRRSQRFDARMDSYYDLDADDCFDLQDTYEGEEKGRRGYRHNWLDLRYNTTPDTSKEGVYSTHMFASHVEDLLRTRSAEDPMFLYLAFQSVHAPLQVPDNYTRPYAHIHDHDRRTFLGMVSAMDEAVGRVVAALRATGHYHNSIIVFTTDNGGPTRHSANNWPLRGHKATLWEGGTRGVAFLHSPLLPNPGTVSHQLIHVTDWYRTLVGVAGGVTPPDTDGVDQWASLTGSAPPPRTHMVYNINNTTSFRAGVRKGMLKLLVGNPGKGPWIVPPEHPLISAGVAVDGLSLNSDRPDYFTSQPNQVFVDLLNTTSTPEVEIFTTDSLTTDVDSLNTNLDSLTTEVYSVTKDVDSLTTDAGSLSENSYSLTTDFHSLTTDFHSLTTDADSTTVVDSTSFVDSLTDYDSLTTDFDVSISSEGESGGSVFDIANISNMDVDVGVVRRPSVPLPQKNESEDAQRMQCVEDAQEEAGTRTAIDTVWASELGTTIQQLSQRATNENDIQISLYNIEEDPEERVNLASEQVEVVEELLEYLLEEQRRYVPADIKPQVPEANPANFGGVWSPGWC
nr:uncharacterized protein LOC123762130 [Procambarus clarkii]